MFGSELFLPKFPNVQTHVKYSDVSTLTCPVIMIKYTYAATFCPSCSSKHNTIQCFALWIAVNGQVVSGLNILVSSIIMLRNICFKYEIMNLET